MKEPSKTATRPTIPPQQNDPKNKGKGKMVKQENPLKKKDQIKFHEEIAQRLQVQLQAELEDKERLAKQKEEDETDIQEKEQKESQKQANPSTEWKGQSQKSSQVKKIQLEGLKLPNFKLYYKR
ncbi:hypothetical protein Tco_0656355 [Tanacetum coccineum]|uniref:Uncharacterized protein n=1 Tax=Tanacetum coccineum TaxID=301880 RepID=A0ABQ4X8J9_9ASTR